MGDPSAAEVAALIYDWWSQLGMRDEIDEPEYWMLEGVLQTSMSLEQFRLMGNKLRSSPKFERNRQLMLDKWGPAMAAGLDEEAADRFLIEVVESFDHSLMFSHTLEAGKTTTREGDIRDTLTAVSGDMPCWTLHLTTRGRALYIGEEEIEVARGDVLLFSPSADCQSLRHPTGKIWVHEWVLFQPRAHWSQWMNWPEASGGIFRLTIEESDSFRALTALSREIRQIGEEAPRLALDLQYNRLEELLIRASDSQSALETAQQDPRVIEACEYIRNRLAEPFTVADVASHCNVSPSRLAHLFQLQMGVGLMHWRNDLRMQQARKLLLNSADSVTAIAEQIGYSDPTQFSKFFSKHIGTSPREFRRSFTQVDGKIQQ